MQETQVDQLIKAGCIVLFMVVLIEISIKVALAELLSKTVRFSFTIEKFSHTNCQAVNQLIDIFSKLFLLSWLKPGNTMLDWISSKSKSDLHSIHSKVINFVWCLFDPLKDTKTASHLSEIATFLGGHIVPVLFIHTTRCECVFCFSLGHITFGQLPEFLPGTAFFVWLLVSNCWQNFQVN